MLPSTIGPYRVTAKLGEGGMGIVYRAHDPRLNREVAIKVLPQAFARDRERMALFEQEARALAMLNHPGIAAIYGVEEGALVMEYVEGTPLTCPVAEAQALDYARQIADALEHAHERGIVHRDLKPANIRVTPEGKVKLLDFGLAKAMEGARNVAPAENSPTLTQPPSIPGAILGTAAYMSPEQAKGARVDHRTDIWAFGVVVYEMFRGASPFVAETVTEILAAVLTREVGVDTLPEGVRPWVRLCLERDRSRRLGWIGEVRRYLDAPAAAPAKRGVKWWAIAAAALVAGIAGGWMARTPVAVDFPVRAYSFAPEDLSAVDYVPPAAISPNGKWVAYAASGKLWLRDLATDQARAMEGTENAEGPFWSPDSAHVAFVVGRDVKRVAVSGGLPTVVAALPGAWRGGAWSPDGLTMVVSVTGTGLLELSAMGGSTPKVLVAEGEMRRTYYAPHFVPAAGNERWLVAGLGMRTGQSLVRINLNNGQVEKLREGAYPTYSPTGHLLFQTDAVRAGIWALPVGSAGKPSGEPVSIAPTGMHVTAARDGTLLWADRETGDSHVVWRDRKGALLETLNLRFKEIRGVVLSRDGRRMAFPVRQQGENADIWIADTSKAVPVRMSFTPSEAATSPVLSPNGEELVFRLESRVIRMRADGVPIQGKAPTGYPCAWSADGRFLLVGRDGYLWYSERRPDGSFGEAQQLTQAGGTQYRAQFSPDGRFAVFESSESGRPEIYTVAFPSGGVRRQISHEGGRSPRWSNDGSEIFYIRDNLLVATRVRIGENVTPEATVEMFRQPSFRDTTWVTPMYAPSPDAKRFLVVEPVAGNDRPPTLKILQNWPAAARLAAATSP